MRYIGDLPVHARFRAALEASTSIEFYGTPLRDVISFIAEIHKLPVVLDTAALSEQGITGDEEVSLSVNGTPVGEPQPVTDRRARWTGVSLALGENRVEVTASDAAGQSASDSVIWTRR